EVPILASGNAFRTPTGGGNPRKVGGLGDGGMRPDGQHRDKLLLISRLSHPTGCPSIWHSCCRLRRLHTRSRLPTANLEISHKPSFEEVEMAFRYLTSGGIGVALMLTASAAIAQTGDRLPDKDVKALIDQVDTGRDKFEGNLTGDVKGYTSEART